MTLEQVQVAWALMLAHGLRRLYECISLQKQSFSSMWAGQYVLGLLFYFVTSIAIWIEGIRTTTLPSLTLPTHIPIAALALQFTTPSSIPSHFLIRPPTLRTSLILPLFILASGLQHDCHAYLAGLKKYTLPEHPMFQILICPHYFAECLIYVSLATIAAPQGAWMNRTLVCALVFVVVNLGVTAEGTRAWSVDKFGVERVWRRWRMVPFVF